MAYSDSVFAKSVDPVYQAGLALAGGLFISLLAKLLHLVGILELSDRFPWKSAAAFLLVFAIFNSVFSLSSKDMRAYWGRSIYCFLALAVLSGLAAWGLSGITINEAGSYRWIFIVVSIGYLVFLNLVVMLRKIVNFAEKEEWTQPRLRNRK